MFKSVTRLASYLLFMALLISCKGVMDWNAVSYFISCLSSNKCYSIAELISKNGLPNPDNYYTFDDVGFIASSSVFFEDYSRNSLKSIYLDTAQFSAGVFNDDIDTPLLNGKSLNIDTTDSGYAYPSAIISESIDNSGATGVTVSLWFKATSDPGPNGYIFPLVNAYSGLLNGSSNHSSCSSVSSVSNSVLSANSINTGWYVGILENSVYFLLPPGCVGSGYVSRKYAFQKDVWNHLLLWLMYCDPKSESEEGLLS